MTNNETTRDKERKYSKKMNLPNTMINYQHDIGYNYDLINDPIRRAKMLEHIKKNAPRFGGIEEFKAKILERTNAIEGMINEHIEEWGQKIMQIDFIDKYQKGEIKEIEETDGL